MKLHYIQLHYSQIRLTSLKSWSHLAPVLQTTPRIFRVVLIIHIIVQTPHLPFDDSWNSVITITSTTGPPGLQASLLAVELLIWSAGADSLSPRVWGKNNPRQTWKTWLYKRQQKVAISHLRRQQQANLAGDETNLLMKDRVTGSLLQQLLSALHQGKNKKWIRTFKET